MNNSIIRTGNVTLDIKPNTSCDYHRLALPYAYLDEAECDVPTFIFNRMPTPGVGFLHQLRNAGVRVIADIDDLPELDHRHYLYAAFETRKVTARIVECLRLAHIVTCTTPWLAEQLEVRYGIEAKRTHVVPNALPFDRGQFKRTTDETDTTFVYAAGASHYRDSTLLPAGRTDVTFAGYEQGHPEWEKIKAYHPESRYKPQRSVSDYMRVYEGHSVALAPLRPGVFNTCKSNLKVLEAGAAGLAIITSEIPPYLNTTDLKAVTYARSAEDWKTAMFRHSMSSALREDAAESLAAHVRKHYSLDKVNEIRKQILGAPF